MGREVLDDGRAELELQDAVAKKHLPVLGLRPIAIAEGRDPLRLDLGHMFD